MKSGERMKYLKSKKSQVALEYTFLLVVVTMVLIAIGGRISRGFQGQIQSRTDDLADQYSNGESIGFETYSNESSSFTVRFSSGWSDPIESTHTSGSSYSFSHRRSPYKALSLRDDSYDISNENEEIQAEE